MSTTVTFFEELRIGRTNHGIEPFAALRVAARNGKIEASACRF